MLYLLDTNAFSDVMRDDPNVRAKIAVLDPSDQVVTCTIVKGEIAFGIFDFPQENVATIWLHAPRKFPWISRVLPFRRKSLNLTHPSNKSDRARADDR